MSAAVALSSAAPADFAPNPCDSRAGSVLHEIHDLMSRPDTKTAALQELKAEMAAKDEAIAAMIAVLKEKDEKIAVLEPTVDCEHRSWKRVCMPKRGAST